MLRFKREKLSGSFPRPNRICHDEEDLTDIRMWYIMGSNALFWAKAQMISSVLPLTEFLFPKQTSRNLCSITDVVLV